MPDIHRPARLDTRRRLSGLAHGALHRLSRCLTALALGLPLLAAAQAQAPISDAERARRDAEKVFSFIKFHTVQPKAAEAPHKPSRPPAAATASAAPPPAPAAPAATATPSALSAPVRVPEAAPQAPVAAAAAATAPPAPAAAPLKPAAALTAAEPPPPLEPATLAVPVPQPAVLPHAEPPALLPEAEADEPDDGALQLQNFIAPVLTPAVQSTLGAGTRNVKVRFTVQADGRVSQAEAAAGVPRRLAKPAVDAILQWQFAPLPHPRTVDVEIAFRRD